MEKLEPDLCMLLLIVCSLFEELADLNITVLLSL
jgi:hypothetical protein